MRAVEHAYRILDWQENLLKEEMPPKWMWHLEDQLEMWFEKVDEERKNRGSGGSSSDESSSPMMQNEFARGKR